MIDPVQLAEKGARLSGELPISGMARLVGMCRDDSGSVRIDLEFKRDSSSGLRTMSGSISARVNVTCQRCLDNMALALSSTPRLLLLRPGERDDLLESGNALAVERPIALGTLVEDELLLALPMVPMHSIESCRVRATPDESTHRKIETGGKERANPFSVLATLKQNR